jgi:hypothetical protein
MWKMCDACREKCRTITLERRKRQKETSGMFSIFKVDLSAGYTAQNMPTGNGDAGEAGSHDKEELGGAEQKGDCKENESATNAISEARDHNHQVC